MADPPERQEIAAFAIAFYSHKTKKTSATEPRKEKCVGLRSIFKRKSQDEFGNLLKRTSCIRQRALLSVCC